MSNFPYLSVESVRFLKERGFMCIAMNTPSFDNEASKKLENHHEFFTDSQGNLIVELLDCSKLSAGPYIADLSLYPIDSDASPCVFKVRKILSAHLIEKKGEPLSDQDVE
jgi:kynurenine formamidase